jgi:Cys-tRNA(Pro)/Cys-tRNA(Cys) deacylase
VARAAKPGASAATPGIAGLLEAGVPHEVVKFDRHSRDPRAPAFGVEAVQALTKAGVIAPEQIYKTLVIAVPGGLAVALVPASARLSLKAAAAALGVAKAGMAEPAAAERATGYVVGAVSPFGQRKRLPTVVDAGALAFEKVYCSAGRRGLDVAVAPQDLIRLTGAITADIRA